MLNFFNSYLICEDCNVILDFDESSTKKFYEYLLDTNSKVEDVINNIDEFIGQFLVYKCSNCGRIYKYKFKDIERKVRIALTQKSLSARVFTVSNNIDSTKDKFFIYCGKCFGFDSNGCCPESIYNNCELRRFNIDVL